MIQDFSAYPDWKAPAEDSGVIVWPEPARILRDAVENHRRLSQWNSPLVELRRRQRQALKLAEDRPAVATGHQTELFHPGVWAKVAMIDAAARAIDADCIFAAVDSDAPKHLQLRWPGGSRPITDDPRLNNAPWCGLLDAPTVSHLEELKSLLDADAAKWSFTPLVDDLLDDLQQQASRNPNLSAALTASMYRLDWSLGLRHQSIVTSRLWSHEPYLAFVHHLLVNADSFAAIYNDALGQYRKAHGIDNPGRPMPDLHVAEESCEVPFWLDDLGANIRGRATVRGRAGQWRVEVAGDALSLSADADLSTAAQRLGQFLQRHNLRMGPRALTLTMFLRLLVVDQFVHGIGGGRYEQVNDQVLHRFFGIDPPAFCVTTATLYFPEAVGRKRACVPCVAHEGHRLRHAIMGPAKMEMVREIQSLPRRSVQRQRVFSRMHDRRNETIQIHPSIGEWQRRMNLVLRQNADEQGMFDRELFYAIQPKDRLERIIGKYHERFEI